MISVGQLSPGDQWDQNMLDLLFENRLYPTGLDFKRQMGYPNSEGCVLLIPGRYWATAGQSISEAIAPYRWVLAMRTGDEADEFNIAAVRHPNIRWWVQTPRTDRHYGDARLFGCGYPPHFNELPEQKQNRGGAFLSAQNNHPRRKQCFNALDGADWAIPTPGFTQGMPKGEYVAKMRRAKVAPAPAGPQTPDTFRVYEALEAHTIPIADDITTAYPSHGYWRMLFPDAPFPILTDYASLTGYINDLVAEWPANANKITVWWMRQKRLMVLWLVEDLEKLGAL